jgi:hypothetical protein
LPADGPYLAAATLRRSETFDVRVALYQPMADGALREIESWTRQVSGPADTEGAYAKVIPRPQAAETLVTIRGFRTWLWSPSTEPRRISFPEPLLYSNDLRWSPEGQRIAGRSNSWDRVAIWNPTTDETLVFNGQFGDVAGWTNDGSALVLSRSAQPKSCFHSPPLVSLSLSTGSVLPYEPASGGGAVGFARTQTGNAEISLATGEAVAIEDDGRVVVIGACSGAGPARVVELPEFASASSLAWSVGGQLLYILGGLDGSSHLWTYSSQFELQSDVGLRSELASIADVTDDGRWLIAREPGDRPAPCAVHVIDLALGNDWPINPCVEGKTYQESFLYPAFAWVEGAGP